jgi:hypothetical protein
MAKKEPRVPENIADLPEEFANAVSKLIDYTHRRKLEEFEGDDSLDVRRVAFGLEMIRQLVDDRFGKVEKRGNYDDIPSEALWQAKEIVYALLTGEDHPILKYVVGIRSSGFRSQDQSAAQADILKKEPRACIVGLARAYAQAAGLKLFPATKAVVATFRDYFTVAQVRTWDSRFRKAKDATPDMFANSFMAEGASLSDPPILSDRVLMVGRTRVWIRWHVPLALPARGRKRGHSRSDS